MHNSFKIVFELKVALLSWVIFVYKITASQLDGLPNDDLTYAYARCRNRKVHHMTDIHEPFDTTIQYMEFFLFFFSL